MQRACQQKYIYTHGFRNPVLIHSWFMVDGLVGLSIGEGLIRLRKSCHLQIAKLINCGRSISQVTTPTHKNGGLGHILQVVTDTQRVLAHSCH